MAMLSRTKPSEQQGSLSETWGMESLFWETSGEFLEYSEQLNSLLGFSVYMLFVLQHQVLLPKPQCTIF